MRVDPVAVTSKESSLVAGDMMNRHNVDSVPVLENEQTRRLIGVIRSEKVLNYLLAVTPG